MTKNAYMERIAGLEERIADFAANCIHICDILPKGRAGASNFKDQLARSATSTAANYAEASIPSSRRDFFGRLTIALKELAESRMHLSVIARLSYRKNLTRKVIAVLIDEADAIAAIFKSAFAVKRTSKKAQDGELDVPKKRRTSARMRAITNLLNDSDIVPRKYPGRKKTTSTITPPQDSDAESAAKKKVAKKKAPAKKKPTVKKRANKRKPSAKRKLRKRKTVAAITHRKFPKTTSSHVATPPPTLHTLMYTPLRALPQPPPVLLLPLRS